MCSSDVLLLDGSASTEMVVLEVVARLGVRRRCKGSGNVEEEGVEVDLDAAGAVAPSSVLLMASFAKCTQ